MNIETKISATTEDLMANAIRALTMDAVQAANSLLHRAAKELAIPVVAIGGITPENGGALIEAGADMLAVIHAVFSRTDIQAACESFKQLFDTQEAYPQ